MLPYVFLFLISLISLFGNVEAEYRLSAIVYRENCSNKKIIIHHTVWIITWRNHWKWSRAKFSLMIILRSSNEKHSWRRENKHFCLQRTYWSICLFLFYWFILFFDNFICVYNVFWLLFSPYSLISPHFCQHTTPLYLFHSLTEGLCHFVSHLVYLGLFLPPLDWNYPLELSVRVGGGGAQHLLCNYI